MRDRSDRYQVSAIQTIPHPKRLGGYLIEAGLITPDQVSVALNDQQATGMRFGEVLVARGWLKEQTVEWIMQKVIMPEKKAYQRHLSKMTVSQAQTVRQSTTTTTTPEGRSLHQPPINLANHRTASTGAAPSTATHSFPRRDAPISKPLPPVNASDEDVNWVG